jgi:hypothetical protein
MWTGPEAGARQWQPNHFVPILLIEDTSVVIIFDDSPPPFPRPRSSMVDDKIDDEEYRRGNDEIANNEDVMFELPRSPSTAEPLVVSQENTYHSDSGSTQCQHPVQVVEYDHTIPCVTSTDRRVTAIQRRFLDINQIHQKLATELLKGDDRFLQVPDGIKSNVAFPVSYANNQESADNGLRCDHNDDCGAWGENKIVHAYYVFTSLEQMGD